jgi:hypothetical protein
MPARAMEVRACLAAVALALGLCGAAAQGFLSGSLGVSPNTMGTLGEFVDLRLRPLSFFSLGIAGLHGKDFQEKLDFEKGGGPMRGNISRDFYRGGLELRPELRLGPVSLTPFASMAAEYSTTYTIARIIDDSGAGYPEDTYAFADFDERELSWGPVGGLELGLAAGPFSASASASYGPASRSSMSGAMFQNYTSYPGSADTYPIFKWRRLGYDFDAKGATMAFRGRFSLDISSIGLVVSGFGEYRSLRYATDATEVAEAWFPTRSSGSSPTVIVAVPAQSLLYSVDLSRTSLELGLSFSLRFLKRAFNLPGVPGLDLSYVRSRNDSLYANKEDPTDRQSWVDDYSYEKLVVSWGI